MAWELCSGLMALNMRANLEKIVSQDMEENYSQMVNTILDLLLMTKLMVLECFKI